MARAEQNTWFLGRWLPLWTQMARLLRVTPWHASRSNWRTLSLTSYFPCYHDYSCWYKHVSVLEHIPFGVWSTQGLSLFKLEKFCHVDLGCLTTALNPTDLIALGTFRHGAKALTPRDNSTLVLKTACRKFIGSCSHLYMQMGKENIFQKATF